MENNTRLRSFVDQQRPFLPLDASTIEHDFKELFFDGKQDLFSEYQRKPQMIIGRRGAGKTAFLESAYFTNKRDLVVAIDKGRMLGQVCSIVDGIPQGGRYPEAVAQLWDSIIYTGILQEACSRYEELRIARDYLAKIGANPGTSTDSIAWTLLDTVRDTQKGGTIGTIAELIRRLHGVSFQDAKDELRKALKQRGTIAIVLIDSLDSEGYLFDDADTIAALEGLLKWVGNTGATQHLVQPRLSIPGEYYHDFLSLSSNPLKDFARSSVLRWNPRQLIALAGVRFRKHLELSEHQDYDLWADHDLSIPRNALLLFRKYIPDSVAVRGELEDSFLFLLRHTQLLPRQFFFMLNELFRAHYERRSETPIGSAEVRECINECAPLLVHEIFGAHRHRHPNAYAAVHRLFPYLQQEVLPYSELHKYFGWVRREYRDRDDFLDMLVAIGAIGKVVETSTRYVRGQFQYNYDTPLSISSKDTLCVHPLFWSAFQRNPRASAISQVWPIGVERASREDF